MSTTKRLEIPLYEYDFGSVNEKERLADAGFDFERPIERRADGKYHVVFIQNSDTPTFRESVIDKIKEGGSGLPLTSAEKQWLNAWVSSDKVLNSLLPIVTAKI